MDRDRGRRFDDGEVVRYGAGESWRPTPRGGERPRSPPPPRRPRSPGRERERSPRPRSPRPRSPPGPASDSYVPGRYAPRRRSQSRGPPNGGDRYRRERSRERDQSPRRRERSRSPAGRRSSPPPRRSLSRRGTPRRPSPGRGDRFERPRSPPRRDWERERDMPPRDRPREREADRDRDWRPRERSRERDLDRRDDRRDERRRSRSPFMRDRRGRSPDERGPSPGPNRGGAFRAPSRSPSRRGGDRYQSFRRSPPRDSGVSSALPSQPASARDSPRPGSVPNRSPFTPRDQSPALGNGPRPGLSREPSARPALNEQDAGPRSPPRGPAALRNPPTGPAAGRNFSNSSPAPQSAKYSQGPGPQQRSDVTSPTIPPSGPKGYVPTRGGYSNRGGRGAWNQSSSRHMGGPSPSPSTPTGPSNIPTGPRAAPGSSTPTQGRPFNPPTGPAASHSSAPRQTLAQSLLNTMPPIIPGGKIDPSMTPLLTGVTQDLEPHYKKLRDEEEKMRDDLRAKQERLRKSLYVWDRLGRESRAWELRSDLSEKSMKNLAGEGMGGAAF